MGYTRRCFETFLLYHIIFIIKSGVVDHKIIPSSDYHTTLGLEQEFWKFSTRLKMLLCAFSFRVFSWFPRKTTSCNSQNKYGHNRVTLGVFAPVLKIIEINQTSLIPFVQTGRRSFKVNT